MNLKQKMSFVLISIILLSATALAAPTTDYTKAKATKAPIAAFSASPTSGNAPLNVQFTDKSTCSPTSWKWSFGDGKYSTAKNPAHTYSKTGTYPVSLTIKNVKGTDNITKSSYITVGSSTVVDVVCKMKIDKTTAEFTSKYKGKTYYFCSASCKEKFDGNPDKYINSQEKDNYFCSLSCKKIDENPEKYLNFYGSVK